MSRPLPRRTLLKCLVVAAASVPFGCPGDGPVEEDRALFPQSVASGDPRPDSVVLWTRALDRERPGEELPLILQVATDERFRRLVLEVDDLRTSAAHDFTLRVKVTRLRPHTRYFYRFLHRRADGHRASPTGRTRTAPEPHMNVPVRFAVANCQDFRGRYYNSWQRLLQLDEELDFVVFLGDYIYEAPLDTPPPEAPERTVRFSDPASALPLRTGADGTVLAAASLSNYRDLYRTYRSDPWLQRVHERYPFVVTWDDHEFSNDCWDAHATYTEGRQEEFQPERRRNAEQVFFEYTPLDLTHAPPGPLDVDRLPRYPNTRLWRDFVFGRHLRLLVTDYRTSRPDHLIPEGAYPATVAVDAAALAALGLGQAFASELFAYVDIDTPELAQQGRVLREAYQQLAVQAGLTPTEAATRAVALVRGHLALAYVNPVLAQAGLPPIDPAGRPRGLAFLHMGKTELFSTLGARSAVVKDTFDVYAAWLYATTGGEAQNALGDAQRAWLLAAAQGEQTWKVLVSSVSPTSMVWDLRKPDVEPPSLRNRYSMSVDQWDGFPDERRRLFETLAGLTAGHTLVVAGDIHGAFASVEHGLACLTAPAISSSSIQEEIGDAVAQAGFPPGTAIYRYVVTELPATLREANPRITFVDTDSHGFSVVLVRPEDIRASHHLLPSREVGEDYTGRPEALAQRFSRRDFLVRPGSIQPT